MFRLLGRTSCLLRLAQDPVQIAYKSSQAAQENLAAVLHGKKDLKLEKKDMPEPQANQILIKMGSVGLCGADVQFYQHGRIGDFAIKSPLILGHEGSGVVEKLGSGVKKVKVGDHVAIEPGVPCRMCKYCKEGRYNLCPKIAFCAIPPTDGLLCRYHVHAADFCHKLPKNLTLEEGALMEPLAAGMYACRRGRVSPGARVLIMGAGPAGLLSLVAARAFGADKIVVADEYEHGLSVAKKLCADFTLQVSSEEDEIKFANRVKSTIGKSPHITIDCLGIQDSMRKGLLATRYGGKFVLVHVGTDNASLPLIPICHEVNFVGALHYRNVYREAISFAASEKANIRPVVTHCFKLEDTLKGLETLISGTGNPLKVLIQCNKFD